MFLISFFFFFFFSATTTKTVSYLGTAETGKVHHAVKLRLQPDGFRRTGPAPEICRALLVPIERRDDEPGADVYHITHQRELPAPFRFAVSAAVVAERPRRQQQRERGAHEEQEHGPQFRLLGPRGATVADFILGAFERDGDVERDGEDGGGEERGEGVAEGAEDADIAL